jgi:hypothetical protein
LDQVTAAQEYGIHRALVLATVLCSGYRLHGAEEAEAEEGSLDRLGTEQEMGHESMPGTETTERATQLASGGGILHVAQEKGLSSMLGIGMMALGIQHVNVADTRAVELAILRVE